MKVLQKLFAPRPDPREELRPLWQAVVDQARRPEWYARLGAVDTVPGRFDMLTAILSVVLVRMEKSREMATSSVLLTELFVADMDGQLRELGIGDPVIGKHVGKLVGAMGGRLAAYRSGLAGDDAALADAASRNLALQEGSVPAAIAAELRSFAARLDLTADADLLAGRIAP